MGWMVFLLLLFGLVLLFDRILNWGFDKLTGLGLTPPKRAAKAKPPHWIVRFGSIFGAMIGFGAVMILPEEMLRWL
jgi:hypothetical protein